VRLRPKIGMPMLGLRGELPNARVGAYRKGRKTRRRKARSWLRSHGDALDSSVVPDKWVHYSAEYPPIAEL